MKELLETPPRVRGDVAGVTREVRAVLDRYVQAMEEEDIALFGAVMAHDEDMVNFGAFGQPVTGWRALRDVIEGQSSVLDFVTIEQSDVKVKVLPSGEDAWATSLWQLHAKSGPDTIDLPIRCSWILQKRDEGWRIVHFHKSAAAGSV